MKDKGTFSAKMNKCPELLSVSGYMISYTVVVYTKTN